MANKRQFLYGGYPFEAEKAFKEKRETLRKKEGKRQGRNTLRKRTRY